MQLSLLRAAFCERPARVLCSIRPASGQYPVSVPTPPDQRPPDAVCQPFSVYPLPPNIRSTPKPAPRGMRRMKPVAHIAAALNGQNGRGRSTLYKWMWDHFDQISQIGLDAPTGLRRPNCSQHLA